MNKKLHVATARATDTVRVHVRSYQVPARTCSKRRLKRKMTQWCNRKGYTLIALTASTVNGG